MSARIDRSSPSNPAGGAEGIGKLPSSQTPSKPFQGLPEVPTDLLAYLEATFPIAIQQSHEQYLRQEGRREIIEHLRGLARLSGA